MISATSAQETKIPDCGCMRIDKKKDSVYIQYNGIREGPKKEKFIILSVHNNTTCELEFETLGNYYRWVDGQWTNCVEDGEEVNVHYLIEIQLTEKDKKKLKLSNEYVSYRIPYDNWDFRRSFRLKEGRSFVFIVPIEYFYRRNFIIVPFWFSWGEEAGSWNDYKSYEVDYSWQDVPESLKKK